MPRAAAQLGARSLPSPQKQLPAPLAQGVGAAGRSSRPQLGSLGADYTATPRGRAVLSRAPPPPRPAGSRQAVLQGPDAGYNDKKAAAAFPAGSAGASKWFPRREVGLGLWRSGTTPGPLCSDPLSLSRHEPLRARWTWLSPDARDGGPSGTRPPGPHPNVSLCLSPPHPPAGLGILTSVP